MSTLAVNSPISRARASAWTSSEAHALIVQAPCCMDDLPYEGGRTAKVEFRSFREYHSRPMIRRTVILVAFVALACAAAPNAARTPSIAPGVIVGGVYLGGLSSGAGASAARGGLRPADPGRVRHEALDGVTRATRRRREHRHSGREGPRRAPGSDVRPARSMVEQEGAAFRRRHRERHRSLGGEREPRQRRKQRAGDHRFAGRHRGASPASRGCGSSARSATACARGSPCRRVRCRRSRRARTSGRSSGSTAARTRCTSTAARASSANSASRRDRAHTRRRRACGTSSRCRRIRGGSHRTPPGPKGEKPVPPGPGNPLGTRWMGLDAAGVGLHGTPDAASIGYSASHGCIRMRIPDAEWLFTQVSVGTPVYIT